MSAKNKRNKYLDAVREVAAANDERANGPKHQVKCPDCGATLSVTNTKGGRYQITFIKHST